MKIDNIRGYPPCYKQLGSLSLVFILLCGCSNFSEKSLSDIQPHATKSILFLQGTAPTHLSSLFWEQLGIEVEKALSENSWYGVIKGKSEQQKIWQNNQQTRLDQQQFQASLALTGISERLLSARLMEGMEVRQTILFQFLALPCTEECSSDESWLMRLQLVDLDSGLKIHRVRLTYKPSLEELSGQPREKAARNQVLILVDRFNEGFVVPWHRLRYENLKSLAYKDSTHSAYQQSPDRDD